MVGNGSTDTLTLSPAPDSVNDVAIYLDGVFQTPGTEYTLAGSTITFTTAPANNVFVCAIVGGGEHIGTPMDNSIGTDKLVDGTLTNAKIDSVSTSKVSGTLPALNANAVTGLNAANLVGNMPAIDGSNLTGISSFTKNANDPAGNTNPAGGVGTIWANTTSGELYVLTDATTDANVWTNVGEGTGDVEPFTGMVATGGSITEDGDYKVHTFTSSSQFQVTTVGQIGTVEYLVVAGGGSGGVGMGSGAGAGGLRNSFNNETSGGGGSSESALSISATSYTVTIGAGGAGVSTTETEGNKGANSVFSSITSIGGGGGSSYSNGGNRDGGSGAGKTELSPAIGQGTANQGYAGGDEMTTGNDHYNRSGGGGGAGAVGGDGVSGNGGNGGVGVASAISGSSVFYAGGGGGSAGFSSGASQGTGGNGGGTAGVDGNAPGPTASTAAEVNTGGASGGSAAGGNGSGNGGSGVVIIRYKFQ
jgi:hypothetical protein